MSLAQRFAVLLGLFALLLAGSPRRAAACSCLAQTVEESRRQACAVFEGVVLAIDAADGGGDSDMAPRRLRVRLRVVQSWTPDVAEETTVTTAASSAACGYGFQVGRGYIIYADGGTLETPSVSLCGGTKPREQAEQDLHQLGMGVVPVSRVEPMEQLDVRVRPVQRAGCASCAVITPRYEHTPSAMIVVLTTLGGCALRLRRRSHRLREQSSGADGASC